MEVLMNEGIFLILNLASIFFYSAAKVLNNVVSYTIIRINNFICDRKLIKTKLPEFHKDSVIFKKS